MDKNLPPGCSQSDIPGERPEDVAWERLFEQMGQDADQHLWDAETARDVWQAGVLAKLSEGTPIDQLSTEGCSLVCEVYLRAVELRRRVDFYVTSRNDTPPGMQSSGFLRNLVVKEATASPDTPTRVFGRGLLKIVADADRCEELIGEVARLTELWMEAVCQGTRQKKVGGEYRHFDGALSTWEEAFQELAQRGLAEGNERDGWVLKWPTTDKP